MYCILMYINGIIQIHKIESRSNPNWDTMIHIRGFYNLVDKTKALKYIIIQ